MSFSLVRKLEYARSYQVFSAWPAISSVIALGRLVWFHDILYVGVSTLELARIRYKYALNELFYAVLLCIISD